MKPDDPAYHLLLDSYVTIPKVHWGGCYICEDPEFAQMGLPLCRPCPKCTDAAGSMAGHVPADDQICDGCGYNEEDYYLNEDGSPKEVPGL